MKARYTPAALRAIGVKAVEIILDKTAKGIDAKGNPFKPYSSKPFAMPAGAVGKGVRKLLFKQGKLIYFKRNKALWVVIKGGYIELKKVIYRKTQYTGSPNLMLSGKMMRSLKVVSVGDNRIIIGFNRLEEAEKAGWNKEKGRDILGLTDTDIAGVGMQELINNVQIV